MIGFFRGVAGVFWLTLSGAAFLVVLAAVRHDLREWAGLLWGY